VCDVNTPFTLEESCKYTGRAASGGALAPEPPRATPSQPVSTLADCHEYDTPLSVDAMTLPSGETP